MEYEIYWDNLNKETQNELLELMSDNGNLDIVPIATIPIKMEKSPLRILKVEPGEVPYEKEIKDNLHTVQEEVGGGLFQPIYLDDGIILCCNEEAKLNGMAPNRWLGGDIICGPFFLVGDDNEGGFVSLTDEQVAECQEMFGEPVQFQGNEPQLDPRLEFYPPW